MSDKKEISSVILERFLLNELPQQEYTALEARLESDPELSTRLQALKNSNQELLEKYPANIEANIIRNKLHKINTQESHNIGKEKNLNWKKASLLFSSAAALILVLITLIPRQQNYLNNGGQGENYAIKGLEPKLEIFLSKKPKPVKLKEGRLIREGE